MKEADIRPPELLEEYLRLSAADAERYFAGSPRSAVPCPGCGQGRALHAFQKNGFDYAECGECGSLYQTPRPPLEQFRRFYGSSASADFWANTFFPSVMEARRAMIFVPRVTRVRELCLARGVAPKVIVEVGAGHGIFLEEWRRQDPAARLCAIEPNAKMAAICRDKGMEVLESIAEDAGAWAGRADLLICFEVIEHVHDPLSFMQALGRLVRPGGHLVMTGLGADGFDIQALWEQSDAVSPPHHLNFLSVRGLEELARRAGFRAAEVTTPGQLDVDIVCRALAGNPDPSRHRFERKLMERGERARTLFQSFLAEHRLSSHMQVFAIR